MQASQNNPDIKEVCVWDDRELVQPKSVVHFICNQLTSATSGSIEVPSSTDIIIQKSTYFNRMVTASIDSITPAIHKEYRPIRSLKSLAQNIKVLIANAQVQFSKPVEFKTIIFDVREIEPNNIAHLMMTAIPFCLHTRNLVGADIQFLFNKMAKPYENLLNAFDIAPIISNKKIKAPFIKVTGTRGHAYYNIINILDCPPISFVPNIYENYHFTSGLVGMSKVFIARRGARGLTNHNEVEKLLAAHGYKAVYMEDYSIAVQLGIASEANDIVAVHGASMGMLVLRKNINSLIEICPSNVYQEYFPIALGSRVKTHIQMMETYDFRVGFHDYSLISHFKGLPFSANINQLNLALAMVNGNN